VQTKTTKTLASWEMRQQRVTEALGTAQEQVEAERSEAARRGAEFRAQVEARLVGLEQLVRGAAEQTAAAVAGRAAAEEGAACSEAAAAARVKEAERAVRVPCVWSGDCNVCARDLSRHGERHESEEER
jgi:hypothetical protein